jgi:hypothetical protein
MDAEALVALEARVELARAVRAPVVDDDELDVARVVDVEDLLHRGQQRGALVVDRHEDRQLHGR